MRLLPDLPTAAFEPLELSMLCSSA